LSLNIFNCRKYFNPFFQIPEAIEFYGQAKCFTQAIRLSKEHGLVNSLISFALQGTNETILDAARLGSESNYILYF
jgi:intraflagellar transport protein 140